MPKFNERLKELRKEAKLSQQEFANRIGISKSSVNMYERGEREPGMDTLEAIADFFNVDMDYLFGNSDIKNKHRIPTVDPSIFRYDNIEPMPNMVPKPLLGTIACGEPILAQENIEDIIPVPDTVHCDFALRCKGDSMKDAKINNGDIVYVRQQPTVENGEIAAVLIDEEATLKRVYWRDADRLELHPANPDYPVMVYIGQELENIRILGKAVGCLFAIR